MHFQNLSRIFLVLESRPYSATRRLYGVHFLVHGEFFPEHREGCVRNSYYQRGEQLAVDMAISERVCRMPVREAQDWIADNLLIAYQRMVKHAHKKKLEFDSQRFLADTTMVVELYRNLEMATDQSTTDRWLKWAVAEARRRMAESGKPNLTIL